MKRIVISCALIFSLIISNTAFSQRLSEEELARKYRVKAMKYENMSQTGTTMMIGGTLALAGGIYALATTEYDVDIYGNYTPVDTNKYLLGMLGVYLGIPLAAGGTVFRVIGKHKSNQYFEKARNISIQAGITSLGITVRF